MSDLTLSKTLVPGTNENVSDVQANFEDIRDFLNGDGWVDLSKVGSDVAEPLGLSSGSTVRRGKSIIPTEETRTSAAYGTLTTPDQVSNVVLPTDGLIVVAFQAMVKASAANNGLATVCLNGTEVKYARKGVGAPTDSGAAIGSASTAGVYVPLFSSPGGLITASYDTPGAYNGDVTTGQVVGGQVSSVAGVPGKLGGPMYIFAAAGTYDVSVQFKASSGSVTAKERKLWVWTMGF